MLESFRNLVPQLKFAFQRDDVELITSLPGRYAITGRQENMGRLPVFACRLCSISPYGAVIKAPVLGFDGERISVHFNEFGILPARVSQSLPEGFEMTFELSQAQREKLAAKIRWQKRREHGEVDDQRRHERLVPQSASSIITLPSGKQENCVVLDISPSGAAVLTPYKPDLGRSLQLGRMIGRVVRYIENGFALQFIELQPPDRLEESLLLPKAEARQHELIG